VIQPFLQATQSDHATRYSVCSNSPQLALLAKQVKSDQAFSLLHISHGIVSSVILFNTNNSIGNNSPVMPQESLVLFAQSTGNTFYQNLAIPQLNPTNIMLAFCTIC